MSKRNYIAKVPHDKSHLSDALIVVQSSQKTH